MTFLDGLSSNDRTRPATGGSVVLAAALLIALRLSYVRGAAGPGTLLDEPPAGIARPDRPSLAESPSARPVRRRWPRGGLFLLTFAGYLAVALLVVVRHDALPGDALARVANAAGALSGRDPHLAAIGFVWSPIPTMVLLPLVALRGLVPALTSVGIAACVVSAAAMASTVVALRSTLAELGVDRVPRLVATLCFAVHPMIVLYGANGMSEAILMLFLVLASRSLARWWRSDATASLAGAGLFLGLAYLSRYEAIAAGVGITAAVLARSWWMRRSPVGDRIRDALVDGALVAFPIAVAFFGWALVSWLIVGQPFEHFTSAYGNSAQVALAARDIGSATGWTIGYVGRQVAGLQPLLLLAVVVSGAAAVAARSARPLVPLVVLGPVSALNALLFVRHQSFGWLRFQIVVIPLAVLAIGAASGLIEPRQRAKWRWRLLVTAVVVGSQLPSLLAPDVLFDRALAREEARLAGSVRGGWNFPEADAGQFAFDRTVAERLDELELGRGEVLTDVAFSFPIVLASHRPTQFVITSDRDFQAALASPWVFGVRYLLVPPAAGRAAKADAVNLAYPTLHQGDPVARPIRDFSDSRGLRWRLFEVGPPPDSPESGVAAARAAGRPQAGSAIGSVSQTTPALGSGR